MRIMNQTLKEGVLEAIAIQALGQGTEIQLSLVVESQKATLSVKRRLACEQLIYFTQATAYYYHGLILDKGNELSCHIVAVSCFLAADELFAESKKACLSFCLAAPVTRAPPPWGVMKLLHLKITEVASKKYQMYGYLLEQEKGLQALPDLPEFQLSLHPDDYELPEIDPAWDTKN
ncbi:hypothetical protein RYX36_030407 [Vicia faba]